MAAAFSPRVLATVLLASSLLATAGCSSLKFWDKGGEKVIEGSPEQLYRDAIKNVRNSNYPAAIERYETLEARYPFSEQAKQGQLDLIYAYYKARASESAIDQADQFIRENPTHPRVDYAYYVRGLVYFESGANWLERQFKVDIAQRPPHEARKSFQAFQTLVQQYPKSPYAVDARQRMIYLRNRLADYEVAVARFYVKRGAYVGAANRAKGVIENFDGAPAVDPALKILAASYRKLGIEDLALVADNVRKANDVANVPDLPNTAAAGAGAAGATATAGCKAVADGISARPRRRPASGKPRPASRPRAPPTSISKAAPRPTSRAASASWRAAATTSPTACAWAAASVTTARTTTPTWWATPPARSTRSTAASTRCR